MSGNGSADLAPMCSHTWQRLWVTRPGHMVLGDLIPISRRLPPRTALRWNCSCHLWMRTVTGVVHRSTLSVAIAPRTPYGHSERRRETHASQRHRHSAQKSASYFVQRKVLRTSQHPSSAAPNTIMPSGRYNQKNNNRYRARCDEPGPVAGTRGRLQRTPVPGSNRATLGTSMKSTEREAVDRP